MSSSVLLNGGNFAIGPAAVEGQNRHRHHRGYDNDDDDDAWEPEDLVATVQFLATLDDRLPAYVLPVSGSDIDFCHVQRDEVPPVSDRAEPVFVVDDDVSQSDNNTTMPEERASLASDSCPAPPPMSDAAAVAAVAADENSSAAQTPCSTEERSIIRATNKPAHLKRVSFGSTKGSMVETLIYEKPAADDEHQHQPASTWRTKNRNFVTRSIVSAAAGALPGDALPEETVSLLSGESTGKSASKVRVTYFESKRPLTLPSPEASDAEWDDTMAEPPPHQQPGYARQTSTESGQDNPFRPDGDLSREADELVELLKGGRPISEVLKSQEQHQHSHHQHEDQSDSAAAAAAEQSVEAAESTPLTSRTVSPAAASPVKAGSDATDSRINNGAVESPDKKAAAAAAASAGVEGVVEVQRVVAPAPAESTAEHVVIKKKSKCNCCVLQ